MPDDLTPIQVEGLDWLALMASGRATADDVAALRRWKAQSEQHVRALAEAVHLRQLMQSRKTQEVHSFAPATRYRATRRMILGGAAAAVASYAVIRPPLGLWPSWAELSSDFSTKVGERRNVVLAKGVSMLMNTQSSAALRPQGNQPGIELIAGEIAMTTSLAPGEQYVVYAGNGKITARRADFNLRMESGTVCVTCTDGDLDISVGDSSRRLAARQQLIFGSSGIGKSVSVDPSIVAAWRSGQLVFHDVSLGTIVGEINRYRPGRIVILSRDLAARKFNCVIHVDHIENMVSYLQMLSNASAARLPGGIVLLS
jgi:transmembrane sensor